MLCKLKLCKQVLTVQTEAVEVLVKISAQCYLEMGTPVRLVTIPVVNHELYYIIIYLKIVTICNIIEKKNKRNLIKLFI